LRRPPGGSILDTMVGVMRALGSTYFSITHFHLFPIFDTEDTQSGKRQRLQRLLHPTAIPIKDFRTLRFGAGPKKKSFGHFHERGHEIREMARPPLTKLVVASLTLFAPYASAFVQHFHSSLSEVRNRIHPVPDTDSTMFKMFPRDKRSSLFSQSLFKAS